MKLICRENKLKKFSGSKLEFLKKPTERKLDATTISSKRVVRSFSDSTENGVSCNG